MKITLDVDFESLSPQQRKQFLKAKGITLDSLSKKHRRSIASISYALDGKREKLLRKISKSINKQYMEVKDGR